MMAEAVASRAVQMHQCSIRSSHHRSPEPRKMSRNTRLVLHQLSKSTSHRGFSALTAFRNQQGPIRPQKGKLTGKAINWSKSTIPGRRQPDQ